MKRMTTTLMFAAASLAAVAGSASAQTLQAEIPFTFRVAHTVMQPGAYLVNSVRSASGFTYFLVQSSDRKKAVILSNFTLVDAPRAWIASGAPRLAFECAAERCVLREVWTAVDSNAYRIYGPKPESGELARNVEVSLSPVKAD